MKANAGRFFGAFRRFFLNKNAIDLIIRFLLFFIIIVALLFIFQNNLIRKKKKKLDIYPNMTIFNDGSSGTMSFKELLESFDFNIEKIMEPLSGYKMSKRKNFFDNPGVLLIIEPQYYFQNKDIKVLEEIARKGFAVIVFSDYSSKIESFVDASSDTNIYSRFNDESKIYNDVSADTTRITYDKYKIFSKLNSLYLTGKKRIKSPDKEWKEIIGDNEGILAIEKKIGDGRIVILPESDFLSNWNLRKEDNVLFAYKLVAYYSSEFKDKKIYFEEYHHGFHKKFTFIYFFAKKEYSALILQAVLFLFLLFYYINIRFGQYRITLQDEKKRIFYFSEGISGILSKRKYTGNIYEKMKNNFFLLLKLKPYHYKKEAKEKVEELFKSYRDKNKSQGLIRKLFAAMKKYENK